MRTRPSWLLKLILSGAGLGFIALLVGWGFLFFSTEQFVNPYDPTDKAAVREVQTQAFAALIQLVGGFFLIGTIYSALRTLRLTEEGLEITREQLRVSQQELQSNQALTREQIRLSREGQLTELFATATAQLGSDTLSTRLGGIYALERIARDSGRYYYWQVMEVLTSYVRRLPQSIEPDPQTEALESGLTSQQDSILSEPPPVSGGRDEPRLPADIQAILSVISRRDPSQRMTEPARINFERAELPGAYLEGAHLEAAQFAWGNLKRAQLVDAHLDGAVLVGANMWGADLRWASLQFATIATANLRHAGLFRANLSYANLQYADLRNATCRATVFRGAHLRSAQLGKALLFQAYLEGADLTEADLEGADLTDAYFHGAELTDAKLAAANLSGANLTGVKGLSQEQIDGTIMDETTILPLETGPDGKPYRRSENSGDGLEFHRTTSSEITRLEPSLAYIEDSRWNVERKARSSSPYGKYVVSDQAVAFPEEDSLHQ